MAGMNPEERELLTATHELAAANNKMLRDLRRTQRWQSFWSAIKWLIVLASALGAYYYLQPYLDKILELYRNLPDFNLVLPR